MTGFGVVAATGMKEIKSDQNTMWAFRKFFVSFGLPKMIAVDTDGLLLECLIRLSKRLCQSHYMQLQGATKNQLEIDGFIGI